MVRVRPGGDTVRATLPFLSRPGGRPGITLTSMFGADGDGSGADGDAHLLPAVLHMASAAVLMIEPRRREVVYANPAAIELTGERVRLPVDIDDWSTPRASPISAGGA